MLFHFLLDPCGSTTLEEKITLKKILRVLLLQLSLCTVYTTGADYISALLTSWIRIQEVSQNADPDPKHCVNVFEMTKSFWNKDKFWKPKRLKRKEEKLEVFEGITKLLLYDFQGCGSAFIFLRIWNQLKTFVTNYLMKSFLGLKKTQKDCSKVKNQGSGPYGSYLI